MRILHVVGGLNRGGAETGLMHLLRHIDRKKYPMDFLVNTEKPCHYDDEAKSLGARIIPCLTPANPLQYAYNFHRILRKYGPYKCIHSHVHQFSGFILALAAAEGIPVRIVHSRTDTRILDDASSLTRRAYIRLMERLIRRFATCGIAVSHKAAESLFPKGWEGKDNWTVFPSGIDFGPFEGTADPLKVRGELAIPLDAHVIGHVGRFVNVKNHNFIVDIAESLLQRDSKALFLLVGDGPLRPEIEHLVHSRGLWDHFVFAGIRTDIPRILKSAMDCFVLPSIYEGLPMSLLEAQAAGLHCVVSDTVSSEGNIGDIAVSQVSLSQPPEMWADCLQKAMSLSRAFVIPESWKRIRSIQDSTQRTEQLYASLKTNTSAYITS